MHQDPKWATCHFECWHQRGQWLPEHPKLLLLSSRRNSIKSGVVILAQFIGCFVIYEAVSHGSYFWTYSTQRATLQDSVSWTRAAELLWSYFHGGPGGRGRGLWSVHGSSSLSASPSSSHCSLLQPRLSMGCRSFRPSPPALVWKCFVLFQIPFPWCAHRGGCPAMGTLEGAGWKQMCLA